MTYPGIGTTNPAHQLETTSNVTAESLEIYSDYTFFGSAEYDWARQLRLRVNTPSSSNVFVDMGLEKDGGDYFYISKPLSAAVDPKNNFRIYQNGRILINRTDATRQELLQVGGDVRVTGNLNVTGTTTVRGDVDITGDLHVTSFNQEKNYIVPEGMIVMWDGAVADIPPGWVLVTDVSGYYLRSNPTQTSVQTGGEASFTINEIGVHAHSVVATATEPGNHAHNYVSGIQTVNASNFAHSHSVYNYNNSITINGSHTHNWTEYCGAVRYNSVYNNTNSPAYKGVFNNEFSTEPASSNHSHTTTWNVLNKGAHVHTVDVNCDSYSGNHEHGVSTVDNVNVVNSVLVNLTPSYRQIRLIKKLPYT